MIAVPIRKCLYAKYSPLVSLSTSATSKVLSGYSPPRAISRKPGQLHPLPLEKNRIKPNQQTTRRSCNHLSCRQPEPLDWRNSLCCSEAKCPTTLLCTPPMSPSLQPTLPTGDRVRTLACVQCVGEAHPSRQHRS